MSTAPLGAKFRTVSLRQIRGRLLVTFVYTSFICGRFVCLLRRPRQRAANRLPKSAQASRSWVRQNVRSITRLVFTKHRSTHTRYACPAWAHAERFKARTPTQSWLAHRRRARAAAQLPARAHRARLSATASTCTEHHSLVVAKPGHGSAHPNMVVACTSAPCESRSSTSGTCPWKAASWSGRWLHRTRCESASVGHRFRGAPYSAARLEKWLKCGCM